MAKASPPEPTLSDALKNADKATGSHVTGLLPDPAAYLASAAERGGVITEQSVSSAGIVQTTFTFNKGDPSEYTEVVYTEESFQTTDVAYELPEANTHLEVLAGAVEAALDNMEAAPEASPVEGTAAPVVLPELTHYSNPLRDHLKAQSAYYGAEIERLARLTENAMKTQSAIHNALSSLDRDGV